MSNPLADKIKKKFSRADDVPKEEGANEKIDSPVQDPAPKIKPVKPSKAKPVPSDKVLFSCGHERPVASFKALRCPTCSGEERRNKMNRMMRRKCVKHRLPDGASFKTWYVAAEERHYGTLTVGEKVFSDDSSGVFKLLDKLDEQWRASQG